ncbi:XRE family transcriptional regulator [Campylobacter concisus]
MKIGQKIRFFREERNLTQQELANLAGVSDKTIQRYEKSDDENLTTNVIKKIAMGLNLDVDILTQKEIKKNVPQSKEKMSPNIENLSPNLSPNLSNLKNQNKSSNDAEENGIIAVPYFEDTYASAGNGAINYEEAPTTLDFNENFLRGFLHISGDLSKVHIINAKGDSMEPNIANGELLFISTANTGGVISGNIYVINYGGDVFVKRLEKNPITKAITLFSDNEKYEPIVIDGENLENCAIVGRVVAHIRKGVI